MIQFDAQFGEYSGVHVTAPSRALRELVWGVVLWLLVATCGGLLHAQEPTTLEAEAPPNQAVLRHTTGGAYFVAKDLKTKYDELLARIERLKADVAAGNVPGDEALRQLGQLEPQLAQLVKEIEERKVLVTPLKTQSQTEELLFDLGAERRLIITADAVRVVGWDGPGVKCVLEKSLLATGDDPEEAEFAALKLVHRHGQASEMVGRTDAEVAADETKFLTEKRDVPLTDEQLANRRRLVDSIQASYAPFRDFQGREVDVVEIDGLTYEQGNRQVTVNIRSEGGGGAMGSDWRRSVKLTVFVPKCNGVLVRGCLSGLAIENVDAPLTLTDAGSRDRDYNAEFSVVGVKQPLAVFNVPLDRIENAAGDVTIVATVEYANTGTTHSDGKRVAYTPAPRGCVIAGVGGDLSAWFSRSNLHVSGVQGKIDVRNEAGDTVIDAQTLPPMPHRVLSTSGRVELQTSGTLLSELSMIALTNDGRAETNADQATLDEVSFTSGLSTDGSRRNWRGFRTPPTDEAERFTYFERPSRVLEGVETAPGLALISRSGAVAVVVGP